MNNNNKSKILALIMSFLILVTSSISSVYADNTNYQNKSRSEFDKFVQNMPKLSENDAKCFLAFIYNDRQYEDNDISNENIYKILTGQLDDYDGNLTQLKAEMLAFSIFVRANLNKSIGSASKNVDYLNDELVQYLQYELGNMKEIDQQIISSYTSVVSKYLQDGITDLMCGAIAKSMNIYLTEDNLTECRLILDSANKFNNIGGDVEKFVKRVVAGIQAMGFVFKNEYLGRYQYFDVYLDVRKNYSSKDDYIFQIIMDYNFLAVTDNTYFSSTIDLTTWITGKDSWANHRGTIESWAEYFYKMEKYINTNHESVKDIQDYIGDINLDGEISATDSVLLMKYLSGVQIGEQYFICDLNNDQVVDTMDAVLLSKYLAGYDIKINN